MNEMWAEVFTNPQFIFDCADEFLCRGAAIAYGLSAWGNILVGLPVPEYFVEGMCKIKQMVGGPASMDALIAAQEQWMIEFDRRNP